MVCLSAAHDTALQKLMAAGLPSFFLNPNLFSQPISNPMIFNSMCFLRFLSLAIIYTFYPSMSCLFATWHRKTIEHALTPKANFGNKALNRFVEKFHGIVFLSCHFALCLVAAFCCGSPASIKDARGWHVVETALDMFNKRIWWCPGWRSREKGMDKS